MANLLRDYPTETRLFIVLAALCAGLSITTDSFLTLVNLTSLINNPAVNVIWAVGLVTVYRARVLQLITRGWSFARFEGGRVVFKAEVACVSPSAAQVQGVWVPPDRRGEGLATSGMAAVVEAVRQDIAPTVSLYVNDWNTAARRAYATVGFEQTATFATLMF